jgi:photosystem II stability/assembly factor-like uncharacterized protein
MAWKISFILYGGLALVLSGACAPTPPPQKASLVWQAANQGLTPHTPVTAIAVDPDDARTLFAGVYGRQSLYASNDGGVTWRRAGEGVAGQPLFALLFDPRRPDRIWAGTADGLYWGIRSRTPEDIRWQRTAAWPLASAVFDLHTGEGGRLFAAGAHPAIWSLTGDETWRPLAPLPDAVGAILAVATAANSVLLAGSDGQGLFISRDGGSSWHAAPEIGQTYVAALWVAPWDDRLLLARTRAGLFRSTDGAKTWHMVALEADGRVDAIAGLAADQVIYLGMSTGKLLRSVDLGFTWREWGSGVDRDGMFYTLITVPGVDALFYAGTQYGLYRSQDGARTWEAMTGGLGVFQARALAQAPGGILYLGNEDGVYVSTDQGERWQPPGAGLPARRILALAIAPQDPHVLYAATEGAGLYRSDDGGATWNQLAWPDSIITGLALDPGSSSRLFARLAYERVYSSDDGGATWTARWDGMATTSEIMSLSRSPHNASVFYAGGVVDLFKSEDGAAHWRRIGTEMAGQSIFYLAVDTSSPETVYAGATKGLYRSDDGGQTWRLWAHGLVDITVTALAFHPIQPHRIYAGTKYRGVYASDDGGRTWQPATAGMGALSIYELLAAADGRWLYAATDQGFWRAALR